MSAYLCDQDTINAIATYAADHKLVADAKLLADLLTLQNVASIQARYPGREWLKAEVIDVAKAYRYERVEVPAARMVNAIDEYDYQACETEDYSDTLCARLVKRVSEHARKLAELERPGGVGAARLTKMDELAYEAGWCLTPDGRWWREPREGESIPAERLETFLGSGPFLWADSALDAVALDAAIEALERPGGVGAARVTYAYRTARTVRGYAAIVSLYRWQGGDYELAASASYSVHATRGKAYRYARHMAEVLARDARTLMHHYDKPIRPDAFAELERPGGVGAAVYWTAKSVNKKTGPIPVSTTSAETCPSACPLAKAGCYAKHGNVGILWHALTRHGPNAAWKHGVSLARSIDWAGLCERVAELAPGTLWRHNQAGDLPHRGQRITLRAFRALVRANRGRRGFTYTHHNVTEGAIGEHNRRAVRAANEAGFTVNLSANNLRHADKLMATGAGPVTVVLTLDAPRTQVTPAEHVVRACPATYAEVTCNKCKWCALPEREWIVGFPPHGSQARAAAEIAQSSS